MRAPKNSRFYQEHSWVRKSLYCFFAFLFFVPASASATDYFVETSANGGSDGNVGTSWGTAKATIQAAIDLATSAGDRVLVAEGTYNERVILPAHITFQLLGGYPSGGGTQDPWTHATVIDGTDLEGTLVYVPGDLSSSFGYFGLVIDGFTLQNGFKDTGYGAGIESWSSDLTIRRCIVQNNTK